MRGGGADDYEDRQYRMRRPLVPRMEHEAKVRELEGRIADLLMTLETKERELREYRRRDTVRRSGW